MENQTYNKKPSKELQGGTSTMVTGILDDHQFQLERLKEISERLVSLERRLIGPPIEDEQEPDPPMSAGILHQIRDITKEKYKVINKISEKLESLESIL